MVHNYVSNLFVYQISKSIIILSFKNKVVNVHILCISHLIVVSQVLEIDGLFKAESHLIRKKEHVKFILIGKVNKKRQQGI